MTSIQNQNESTNSNVEYPKMPGLLKIVVALNILLLVSSIQNSLIIIFLGLDNLAVILFFITGLIGIPIMALMLILLIKRNSKAETIALIRSVHLAFYSLTGIIWMAFTQYPNRSSGTPRSFDIAIYVAGLVVTLFFVAGLCFAHFFLLSRKQVKDYFLDVGATKQNR